MASTGGRHGLKRISTRITEALAREDIHPGSRSNLQDRSNLKPQLSRHGSHTSSSSCSSSSSSLTCSIFRCSSNSTTIATSDNTVPGCTSSKKSVSFSEDGPTVIRPLRSKFSTSAIAFEDLNQDLWVRQQVLLKLIEHVPHLLQTFCILDLQTYGCPPISFSSELLPKDGVLHTKQNYIHGEYLEKPWLITAEKYGDGRFMTRLTVSGELHDPSDDPKVPKQRFYGHLELSDLVNMVRRSKDDVWTAEDPPPDIWFALAVEEMDAKGIHVHRRPRPGKSYKVSRKDQLDLAMELLRYIHRDYFFLKPSEVADVHDISLVSPSLLKWDRAGSQPHDLSSMTAYLAKGAKFSCKIIWKEPVTVYCIPMAGEGFQGWLCFLVDSALPTIW